MLRQPQQASSFRFSTKDFPVCERRKAVCELRERGILPIEPLAGRALYLDIVKWSLPGAGILAGTLCGLRHGGSPQERGVSDDVFFGVNLAGRSTAFQRGREITFGDGDAIVLSCAEASFSIARPRPVRFVGLRVPRKQIAPLVIGVDDLAMRLVPGATDALKLLTRYLRAILNDQAPLSAEIAHAVATHLHDLIALSVGATRDNAVIVQARGVRAARLQAIKSDIVAKLADGSLSVADIAARHGVTPRYVHKLFEDEGMTFTQFILRQRLDRAYRMLRDQRLLTRSITSIAYDVGFGDLSYFNRSFRRRYNVTPSDIRHGANSFAGEDSV